MTEPGTPMWWHYRPPRWQPGAAEALQPVTCVNDTADTLAVWLAPGTLVLTPVMPNGAEVRTLPVPDRFRTGRASARLRWFGNGALRIAPADRPWTVSLFRDDAGGFLGWYVNLERRTGRDEAHVYAVDHILDVWIAADGTVHRKDEDELDAAVLGGRFTSGDAERIRADASHAEQAFRRRDPEFATRWTSWRAPADWPVPQLPDGTEWGFDLSG